MTQTGNVFTTLSVEENLALASRLGARKDYSSRVERVINAFPDLAKRHFSGLLGCQTRHADGLLSLLKGYFELPVDLERFHLVRFDVVQGNLPFIDAYAANLAIVVQLKDRVSGQKVAITVIQ